MIWSLTGTDDGNVDAVVSGLDAGMAGFSAVDDATDVAVVGFRGLATFVCCSGW